MVTPSNAKSKSESESGPMPGLVPTIETVLPRQLPVLLRRAWYGLNQAFRRRIAHLGITPDQYTVLRTLSESSAKGPTQRALTDLMASDPNTVAALVDRMVDGGLIERQPHERDRRAVRIRVLPKGREKFRAARRVARSLQEEVQADLAPGEQELLLDQLSRLAQGCRRALVASPLRKDVVRP